MKQTVKLTLYSLILSACVLAWASPAAAQENATSAAPSSPAGVGILIFLMGLLAIGLVAFAQFAQKRAAQTPDDEYEDE